MFGIICLFTTFAFGFAADMGIYNVFDYHYLKHATPVIESALPWKFAFRSTDRLYMTITYFNTPPNVIKGDLSESGVKNTRTKTEILPGGKKCFIFVRELSGQELIISANLYTLDGLCTSIKIAEGRLVPTVRHEETEKECKYADDICFRGENQPCVLQVNFKNFTCHTTSVSETNFNTTTVKTVAAVNVFNNNTSMSNAPTSPNVYTETTTIKSTASGTNVKTTSNTVIIISSLFGVTLILLTCFAIWKCCWTKQSPQATPDLATNQNHQPFYVNLLFRRECDEEIAEIQQHHYEEIPPQVSTEGS